MSNIHKNNETLHICENLEGQRRGSSAELILLKIWERGIQSNDDGRAITRIIQLQDQA